MISYLALGDSLTEGIGATGPEHNFVAQYFRHLKKTDQCVGRNFGVSGMMSSELAALIENPAISRLLPRVTHISITTGGCDFIQTYQDNGDSTKEWMKTIHHVREQVRNILKYVRKCNEQATIRLLGFYIPGPGYEYGVDTTSVLVQTMNYYYEKAAKEYGAHFIDPFHAFFNRLDYLCDEVHPNQQGHDVLAELFTSSEA